ncbi:MAG: hypothetical protein OXD30_14375 [Bryobacterales bacterium]|nr:hypothetical protein [Bryobacterales bacterium]
MRATAAGPAEAGATGFTAGPAGSRKQCLGLGYEAWPLISAAEDDAPKAAVNQAIGPACEGVRMAANRYRQAVLGRFDLL